MLASVVLVVAAPLVLVMLALGLAALKERAGPCRPRYKCMWGFLSTALVPGPAPVVPGQVPPETVG